MKLGLVSLGCAKNLVDSEMILALMKDNEFEIVNDASQADVIIINTCGFIESSKQESINTIIEMGKLNKILIVTGCLVQRYKEELEKELPEVSLFVPIYQYPHLAELISNVVKNKQLTGKLDLSNRVLSTAPYTAYLKISEGCNNRCHYCAIPLIRGGFVSIDKYDLIKQAKILASKGITELVVISQDTTRYGEDIKSYKTDIVDLLKSLLEIKEFKFIRLLYLYPNEVSDELIDLIGSEPRLTPYFDIPIQHSSDHMLSTMNRHGDKQTIVTLFDKIKQRVPNAILRTTLIVGYPGESEEDFEDLKQFITKYEFNHLGAFTYSREDGTIAYSMDNQIPENIKQKRYNEIMRIQKKISLKKNKQQIGTIHTGLVIDYDPKEDVYSLRSHWNAPDDIDGSILFKSDIPLEEGKQVNVKITDCDHYNLYGELVK